MDAMQPRTNPKFELDNTELCKFVIKLTVKTLVEKVFFLLLHWRFCCFACLALTRSSLLTHCSCSDMFSSDFTCHISSKHDFFFKVLNRGKKKELTVPNRNCRNFYIFYFENTLCEKKHCKNCKPALILGIPGIPDISSIPSILGLLKL